jgi:hypothetical protein
MDWKPLDRPASLIRLEEEQKEKSEIPLPGVLIEMPNKIDKKEGRVFDGSEKRWHRAWVLAKLGTLTEVDGKHDPRYTGPIVQDLRWSAIKNLTKVGVNEKIAITVSGQESRDVFDRYHIVDTEVVVEAMRRVQSFESDQKRSDVQG